MWDFVMIALAVSGIVGPRGWTKYALWLMAAVIVLRIIISLFQ